MAHAMKLVDAAIENLESVAPASPRRRPRTSNRLHGLGGEASDAPPDHAGAHALLAALQERCNNGSGGSAEVTAADVQTLQAALAGRLADKGRSVLQVSNFSAVSLAASLSTRSKPISLLRSWSFDVFACAAEHPQETMATVGFALFDDAGLIEHFGLNATKLVKFLAEVCTCVYICSAVEWPTFPRDVFCLFSSSFDTYVIFGNSYRITVVNSFSTLISLMVFFCFRVSFAYTSWSEAICPPTATTTRCTASTSRSRCISSCMETSLAMEAAVTCNKALALSALLR